MGFRYHCCTPIFVLDLRVVCNKRHFTHKLNSSPQRCDRPICHRRSTLMIFLWQLMLHWDFDSSQSGTYQQYQCLRLSSGHHSRLRS
ncbi:hypothetical protein BDR04DRAFT_662013 [Suillus decipiens]|nr:hypothetical protein BDR04DRAFT_662013 [Suillus decipiens]